jgi:hypothetical protein
MIAIKVQDRNGEGIRKKGKKERRKEGRKEGRKKVRENKRKLEKGRKE